MVSDITIKVADGEITIPTTSQILFPNGRIKILMRAFFSPKLGEFCFHYFIPSTCGTGVSPASSYKKAAFKGVKTCEIPFWNHIVGKSVGELRRSATLQSDGSCLLDE